MKIYSKFHDYYDCIQRNGVDKSISYNREQKEVYDVYENENLKLQIHAKYGLPIGIPREKEVHITYDCKEDLRFFIVGFCGELYPGIESRTNFIYSVEDLYKYFSKIEEPFLKKQNSKKFLSLISNYNLEVKNNCVSWLNNCCYPTMFSKFYPDKDKIKDKIAKNWFLKFKVPIFLLKENCGSELIIFNPCLKNIHFVKKFHPQEAFQKIQQFISNDLAEIKDGIVNPPTEKDRLIGHGFDPKWSFRKEPETIN